MKTEYLSLFRAARDVQLSPSFLERFRSLLDAVALSAGRSLSWSDEDYKHAAAAVLHAVEVAVRIALKHYETHPICPKIQ